MAKGKGLLDWKEDADYFSGKLSEITRQLTFAGLGILWIIREYNKMDINTYLSAFFWPLIFLIATLLVDFIQYLLGYIINHQIFRENEKKVNQGILKIDSDITATPWKIGLINGAFKLKILLLLISFILIIITLCRTLNDFNV